MCADLFIGIDVGTTSIKAGLFDLMGNEVGAYHASYLTSYSNNMVEQDAEVWLHHIHKAISKFADICDIDSIKAIGITSQVNTHVFVDENYNALTPAIVWQDTRCASQAVELDAKITQQQKMSWWGAPMPVDASHCLARMSWMAKNRPDIWEKTKFVLLPKDYCIARLTGELVSDPTSNIGLVDLNNNYIPALLDLVPGAAHRLAPLKPMTQIAGVIKTGHPLAGIPIAVTTMDAWAGMFGVGVQKNNQAYYLSGTSEILGVISPKTNPTPGVLVFPKTEDLVVHAAPTQSGGASIMWHCELYDSTPQEMSAKVSALDFSKTAPLFLPHLAGERAPIWDPNARGVFLGLNSQTQEPQIARAIFEGVGFSARWVAQTLFSSADIKPQQNQLQFHCGGGGFKSDIFNQIRANILGVSLKRTQTQNPGLLGAVALAAVGVGAYDTLADALDTMINFDTVYQPDQKQHERYSDVFELYKQAYYSTRDISHKLLAL